MTYTSSEFARVRRAPKTRLSRESVKCPEREVVACGGVSVGLVEMYSHGVDVLTIEIDRIGALENTVIEEPDGYLVPHVEFALPFAD
jgi:hypothetical protein